MPEGRVVEPEDRAQLNRGTKVLAISISLSHPPAEIPKGTSSHHQTCLHQANTQCYASVGPSLQLTASLLVLQGPSRRGPPPTKLAKPAPLPSLCTLQIHPI